MRNFADDPEHRPDASETGQARSDLAAIEGDLQYIMGQLASLPTRDYLGRLLLVATATMWVLLVAVALLLAH
jgi:hypothetical protein